MLKRERQSFIVQQLNIHNKVLSADLSVQLQVSEDTVRRDLQELSDEGRLLKVHGGALSSAYHFTLQDNKVYALREKQVIARKAVGLIKDGMLVLLAGGTTIRELVKALPPTLNATFVTISIPIALELLHHPTCEVIFIGNRLSKNTQVATGAEVVTKLKNIKADLCFMGVNSIDVSGISDLEWEIIEVKKAMIGAAKKTACLSIAEKLHSTQKLKVCELNDIDMLITELPGSSEAFNDYRFATMEIL